MPMPWLECGDHITVIDSLGIIHNTIITHMRYGINGKMTIECNVADATERDEMLALPAFISRSTIAREMLVADALKSSNFVDDANSVYSQSGTYFDLAQGFIKSKEFAIDKDGKAYFNGYINTTVAPGDPSGFEINNDPVFGVEMSWYNTYAYIRGTRNNIDIKAANSEIVMGTICGLLKGLWAIEFQTTAPTQAYSGTGYQLVFLLSPPATKYGGYIYFIKNDGIYFGGDKVASI